MNEVTNVYVPRICVAGTVLTRQNDGSYTGSAHRLESSIVEDRQKERGEWAHYEVKVPWDVRIGQEWLRAYPEAWGPAQ